MTFDDLGLSDAVRGAVKQAGYSTPTPIQAQAIPHILERRDVLGIAQTGTGKTAAFTLPMLTMLETGRARARMPRTLIVEPTRELAAQVQEAFEKYGVNHKLSVALLIGGVSFGDQDLKISRGADVLIATPGRLLDHVERGKLLLSGVELLVIDEADRMLDMGFIPDIERICKLVPFTRQTLFFTATMPPEIQRLTGQFLHNPVQVEVARPATTASTITQTLVATSDRDYEKRETLRQLLGAPELKNAIIFCNRKRSVVELHRSLMRHNFSVAALHGDMDQPSRMRALDSFRQGSTKFLVASDVAARGLDIPAVSHIFNFDVPHHSEDYVHRIGRTGRAGLEGTAITLVAPSDAKSLDAIEKLIGQPIPWSTQPVKPAEAMAEGGPSTPRKTNGERSRSRTGSGRRASPAASSPNAKKHAVRPVPEREPAVRQEVRREASPHTKPAPARRSHEAEAAVVGLGDHVPSFLLRPVRTGA
ncbi:MAG: DEAD/DEAH box helicase [Hyphomicrobiales bacterium]|nr:DEAD/DEAH box helicase [Hyphomicrobiales bacterium]